MSKVTLALGSFLLGLCVMYLFGSHTFTSTQSVLAQEPQKRVPVARGIAIEPAEPRLFPLSALVSDLVIDAKVKTQQLDSLNCEECVINAETLTYAGGLYNCKNCKLTSDHVELRGAALNTVVFLNQIGALGGGAAPMPHKKTPIDPNAPNFQIAADKKSTALMLVSAAK